MYTRPANGDAGVCTCVAGPNEKAMWALGDKIASSIVAQSAGVPTLPWSGSGLSVSCTDDGLKSNSSVTVPQDIYMYVLSVMSPFCRTSTCTSCW